MVPVLPIEAGVEQVQRDRSARTDSSHADLRVDAWATPYAARRLTPLAVDTARVTHVPAASRPSLVGCVTAALGARQPFADLGTARHACVELKARKVDCIVRP